jgi:hypothetical protein
MDDYYDGASVTRMGIHSRRRRCVISIQLPVWIAATMVLLSTLSSLEAIKSEHHHNIKFSGFDSIERYILIIHISLHCFELTSNMPHNSSYF